MSLSAWGRFKRLFSRKQGDDPSKLVRYWLQLPSGIQLTESQTMELSAVWACVHIIAVSIGACTINVTERRQRKRILRTDDPMHWLLNTRPNPDMTAIGFRESMLFYAVPFGNAYAEITRDRGGTPVALWPLVPDRVTPRRDPLTWQMFYEYQDPNDGSTVRLEQRDVFHLRGPGLNGLMGDNIVARAARSLAVVAAQERYAASYFGNGANPGGVLEYPGTLSPERHAILAEDFARQRSGPENAHKPLILEDGMKWNSTALEPQKSQLIEERQFSVEEIARWFNVPLHKIQHLLHATFSNIEHQSIEFVRDCLTPWCKRFEQEGDYKFFGSTRGRITMAIDTSPLKEGDAKSRAEANAINRQNGVMTANEIREKEGLNSVGPEGDVLMVQSNMATVANIIAAPPPGAGAGSQDAPDTEPEDAEEDDTEEEPEDDVATEALSAILIMALGRYNKRMNARREDLQKHMTKAQVAAAMETERAKQVTSMFIELAPCAGLAVRVLGRGLMPEDLARAIELMEAGQPPASVVVGIVPNACNQTRRLVQVNQ